MEASRWRVADPGWTLGDCLGCAVGDSSPFASAGPTSNAPDPGSVGGRVKDSIYEPMDGMCPIG